jgi:hypothetical protein
MKKSAILWSILAVVFCGLAVEHAELADHHSRGGVLAGIHRFRDSQGTDGC